MIIYHGSKQVIKTPVVNGSDEHNDYGASFYLTTDLESAKVWACKHNTLGIVNEYEIRKAEYEKLKILDLTNKEKYTPLNWIAILVHFRKLSGKFRNEYRLYLDWLEKYYIDISEYDVVIGYRADDAYFAFPISFIQNQLSYDDLERIYRLGNLGVQQAFMSERAIKLLKFIRTRECDESYIGKYYEIVRTATKEFEDSISGVNDPYKTYIIDMIRGEK